MPHLLPLSPMYPVREDEEAIALDFLKTPIDIFIGGGEDYFTKRADGRNLVQELIAKGYFHYGFSPY
jgi:alkaline phosphatase